MNIVIADDEPIARDILVEYAEKIPALHIVAVCENALEVVAAINNNQVDLLLLDINMPEITGVDLIKTLKNPPQFIFTTAYSEYALEGYELNAVDYLLKPISFERFLAAINKVTTNRVHTGETVKNDDDALLVKSGTKLLKINLADIVLIEGEKDYVKIHTATENILVYSTMKNVEEKLAVNSEFVRVHKSSIVNIKYVKAIEGNMLKLNRHTIVIGNTYKENLQKLLGRYRQL